MCLFKEVLFIISFKRGFKINEQGDLKKNGYQSLFKKKVELNKGCQSEV
jgi:hypothetical protein